MKKTIAISIFTVAFGLMSAVITDNNEKNNTYLFFKRKCKRSV